MDKTVVVLIGAGVCCVVIGLALFVKLLTTKNDDSDEASGNKKLLDEEYAENFQECFDDTEISKILLTSWQQSIQETSICTIFL